MPFENTITSPPLQDQLGLALELVVTPGSLYQGNPAPHSKSVTTILCPHTCPSRLPLGLHSGDLAWVTWVGRAGVSIMLLLLGEESMIDTG